MYTLFSEKRKIQITWHGSSNWFRGTFFKGDIGFTHCLVTLVCTGNEVSCVLHITLLYFQSHPHIFSIFFPGRGIFYNKDKTFLVWVNEEDHLRIISMEKGGDLAVIYDRLVRAVTKIGEKFAFSRHQRIGFLTFCPTNLGTTVRASVHIRVPKLSADRKKLVDVANMYNLQVTSWKIDKKLIQFHYRLFQKALEIVFK